MISVAFFRDQTVRPRDAAGSVLRTALDRNSSSPGNDSALAFGMDVETDFLS